jgi:hypothetical protein
MLARVGTRVLYNCKRRVWIWSPDLQLVLDSSSTRTAPRLICISFAFADCPGSRVETRFLHERTCRRPCILRCTNAVASDLFVQGSPGNGSALPVSAGLWTERSLRATSPSVNESSYSPANLARNAPSASSSRPPSSPPQMRLFNRKGSKPQVSPNGSQPNSSNGSLRSPGPTPNGSRPTSFPDIPLPKAPDPTLDPAGYLRSIYAVRERSKLVLEKAKKNQLKHFTVDMTKFGDVASFVVSIIKVSLILRAPGMPCPEYPL